MKLHVTRRTSTVELLLDQQLAARISDLGIQLASIKNNGMENNPQADQLAHEIDTLHKQARESTLTLVLESLPYSAWLAALRANTTDKTGIGYDMLGVISDALPQMISEATYAGEAAELTKDEIRELLDQLPDTLVSTLWNTVSDLNAKATDPKASYALASKVLANS